MNKKTLTALAAFVVLGVIAFVAVTRPEKGESPADHKSPIAKIDSAEVDTIEVTKAGATTVIKKEGTKDAPKYKLTSPVAYPADDAFAKAAFEAVGKLDVSDLVTEQKAKQAEFEVDDKSGLHLVVKKGPTVLADLIVSKSTGPGTMVRLPGKDDVWQANGISRYTFDKAPADWRDKSITTFAVADAEKVEVVAHDGGKLVVKKTGSKEGSDDKWEIVESTQKIDKLDNSVPTGIVSALSSWKANDFADGVQPAAAGLDKPRLTVTVALKGGKQAKVLLGDKKGADDVYVKTADAPQIYLVKKFNLERVDKRPIEFRDKTLCNIADSDLTEVAVTHGDNSYALTKAKDGWKATKPGKLEVDTSKLTSITAAFKDWKASAFAEDASPKATGLVKPQAVIVGKAKAASCTLKVGDETKDKLNYFATTATGKDVYLAPKWSVDRLLVKLDDIKKAGTSLAKK